MGFRLPVTWGQLRVVLVVFFFFLAINVVLYASAVFRTTTSAATNGGRYIETHDSFVGGNDRISLKARWRLERRFKIDLAGKTASPETTQRHGVASLSDKRKLHGDSGKGSVNRGRRHQVRWTGGESENQLSGSLPLRNATDEPHLQMINSKPRPSTMAATGKDFDAERVLTLFQGCKAENGELSVDCYNDAYEELCKLFKQFGTIFSFVTSDIVEKIGILREYRKTEVGEDFRTIQSMVKYEVDNDLTIQKKKASGCRTLLRLHRALEFISALLTKIRNTDNSCKFSNEATEAYDSSLAKFHPWVIKKAVHVAMYALPDRQSLLTKLKVPDTPEGMAILETLIQELTVVYDITQELYASNNLLDLP